VVLAVLGATSAGSWHAPAVGAAEPVRLMPVGDSITEGANGDATYRYFLWHALLDAGSPADFVGSFTGVKSGTPRYPDFDQDHSARSGWKAQRILHWIKPWTSANQPDVMLLHIGTNDLRAGESNSSTETEIRNIIKRARQARPALTILLAQLIPSKGFEAKTADLNTRIAAIASSMSTGTSRVLLVDQYSGFSTTGDLKDGLHPNESGDQTMSARWYAALQTVLSPSTVAPSIVQQPADQRVVAGATATFGAAASGAPAPTYQWYRDDVAISGANASSYTTPPTSLADSGAVFHVVVSNSSGTATSNNAVLTVDPVPADGPDALVVLNTTPGLAAKAADALLVERIRSHGFDVTTVDDDTATGASDGYELIFVSGTTDGAKIGNRFAAAAVPVVTTQRTLLDDLGMTASSGFGTATSATNINVPASSHPLAAQLRGIVPVTTVATTLSWGRPASSAVLVASTTGDATKATVFGYESGASMATRVAPARRVSLFLSGTTASSLTNQGWALVDAAISWAVPG
jgi:lysophospholipase L1-like esterase